MVYTDREKLARYQLSEERETLTFEEIAAVLEERPSNTIYLEYQGLLYGIITMGRVSRAAAAGQREVPIARKFTKISHTAGYLLPRQIFFERENINAIPVVDDEGRLLGDYMRWNDQHTFQELFGFLDERSGEQLRQAHLRIAFVSPGEGFARKQELMESWMKELSRYADTVEMIDRKTLPERWDDFDWFLVSDTNENLGLDRLYKLRKILRREVHEAYRIVTYKSFFDHAEGNMGAAGVLLLQMMQKQGVQFLMLQARENERGFLAAYNRAIDQKYAKFGFEKRACYLPSAMKPEFFGEKYDETYAWQEFPIGYIAVDRNGIREIRDAEGELFHVRDGRRITVGQPEQYDRCIYMYGPCIIVGSYTDDEHTIASILQGKLNRAALPFRVENYGVHRTMFQELKAIASAPLKQGDIVVWYNNKYEYDTALLREIPCINLTDVVEKNQAPVEWFVASILHSNYKANQLYADAIYEKLLPMLQTPVNSREPVRQDKSVITQSYIDQYFANYPFRNCKTVGAIVMNCNPFTRGHRYLIEQARQRVEGLIIFVVEEERSLFPFEERYRMVRNGTADMENVMVVPSGEFILSQRTFPEYFIKEEDEDIIPNMENDITIFATEIAPKLNITCRFVGEEPEDMVTNGYNDTMKRLLPGFGIQVVEIPRLTGGEQVISASRVRRCLEEGNRELLDALVPPTTMDVLFQKNE